MSVVRKMDGYVLDCSDEAQVDDATRIQVIDLMDCLIVSQMDEDAQPSEEVHEHLLMDVHIQVDNDRHVDWSVKLVARCIFDHQSAHNSSQVQSDLEDRSVAHETQCGREDPYDLEDRIDHEDLFVDEMLDWAIYHEVVHDTHHESKNVGIFVHRSDVHFEVQDFEALNVVVRDDVVRQNDVVRHDAVQDIEIHVHKKRAILLHNTLVALVQHDVDHALEIFHDRVHDSHEAVLEDDLYYLNVEMEIVNHDGETNDEVIDYDYDV